jgi:hypothetical protein
MGLFRWLRERREFEQEVTRRTIERMTKEGNPNIFDHFSGAVRGWGARCEQAVRVGAEVEAEMKRERQSRKR